MIVFKNVFVKSAKGRYYVDRNLKQLNLKEVY